MKQTYLSRYQEELISVDKTLSREAIQPVAW